jgi:protein translocase SecG subunit
MDTIISYLLIILSVALIAVILMQVSESGMGALFGDDGEDGINRTRRGAEKMLFHISIVLAVAFAGFSLVLFLI